MEGVLGSPWAVASVVAVHSSSTATAEVASDCFDTKGYKLPNFVEELG